MRAAVYYSNHDVRLEELPTPGIGPGEALVRVAASGICGSDVMEWYRIQKAPLVLGHEMAGQIVTLGEGVGHYRAGDRVIVAHHVPCNTCRYCLSGRHTVCNTLRSTNVEPGGFAEYIRLPSILVDRGVFPLPEEVSFEEATFTEPLACVLRGQRLAGMRPGMSVMVIGSGIAGLLHIQAARALGVGRIVATDVVDFRLEAALRFGAGYAIHAEEAVPERLRQLFDGWLPDISIVCAGATGAIEQGLRSVERGGTVLLFAPGTPGATVPLQVNDAWFNGTNIVTTYAGSPTDYVTALELIRARRVPVGEMITHRLGLAETDWGFQLVAEARDSIKVIIEPQK